MNSLHVMRRQLDTLRRTEHLFLYLLFFAAFLHSFFIFTFYLDGPLTDMHAFRQTQTAVTAFWLPEHWAVLDYQTPVVGSPWSIPYEFPLYQILAALLHAVGMPLAVAGRCLSWFAMLAVLFPAQRILRCLSGDNEQFLFFAPLYLASPIYVFWGRTFMIETFSLFLFTLFLWATLAYRERGSLLALFGAGLFGCLGLLVKVTTAPPFYLAGALLLGEKLWAERRTALRRAAAWAGVMAVTVAVLVAWVAYSDAVKAENVFGRSMTALALRQWNFGTLAQRADYDVFIRFMSRAMDDIFGYCGMFVIILFFYPLLKPEARTRAFLSLLFFVLPLAIFYNLHVVHNYYQTPVAIFVVLFASLVMSGLHELGYVRYSNFLCGFFLLVMVGSFHLNSFETVLENPNRLTVAIGDFIKKKTPQHSAVVVFGIDWSSEINYYSERKGIAFPKWAYDRTGAVVGDIDAHLGGLPLGAVVLCPNTKENAWRPFAQALVGKMRHPETVGIGPCLIAVDNGGADN